MPAQRGSFSLFVCLDLLSLPGFMTRSLLKAVGDGQHRKNDGCQCAGHVKQRNAMQSGAIYSLQWLPVSRKNIGNASTADSLSAHAHQ